MLTFPFVVLLAVELSALDGGAGSGSADVTLAIAAELAPDHGTTPEALIRPGFRGTGGTWAAPPRVAASAKWTVCFDGSSRGVVESERTSSESLGLEGTHRVKRGLKSMFVGARTLEFAGWLGAPVHHPLVLSSTGRCEDPEGWKPRAAPGDVLRKVRDALRKAVRLELCAAPDRPRAWSWPEDAVETVKAYASSRGDWLLLVRVKRPVSPQEPQPCSELLGDEWSQQLFSVRGRDEVRHLGSGMAVIDAGDYDGDGRSELVVMQSSYNSDAYVLFFDGFARRATVGWSYH